MRHTPEVSEQGATSSSTRSPQRVEIDFETRSNANLKQTGVWRYASDPTTQVMMLSFRIDGGETKLWYSPELDEPAIYGEEYKSGPNKGQKRLLCEEISVYEGDAVLDELSRAIFSGAIIEAHNAMFERAIWRCICMKRFGWPDIPDHQWRCSAAKAAAYAIPRSLEAAGTVMGLDVQKDMEGSKLLMRLCKTRKPTKDNPRIFFGSNEEFRRLGEYCKRDVDTEYALSNSLPDLPASEWDLWHVDQAINERGVQFDLELVTHCRKLVDDVKVLLNEEFRKITGIEKATRRVQLLDWVNAETDLDLPDLTADTVRSTLLRDDLEPYVRRALELRLDITKTTPAKFDAILLRTDEDGRARDNLMFNAASTGRWGGRGIQLQNLKRGTVKDMVRECAKLLKCDAQLLLDLSGKPIDTICDIIRGTIIASPGRELIVADYASIEARGVMWLANDAEAMDVFFSGADIYCEMASDIYGRKVTKDDGLARQLGKQAILGLGYAMGAGKFLITCRGYGIEFNRELIESLLSPEHEAAIAEELLEKWHMYGRSPDISIDDVKSGELVLAKFIVDRYRQKYRKVVELWDSLNAAAVQAIKDKTASVSRWVPAAGGKVHYKMAGEFLFCRLPSGRLLSYPGAHLGKEEAPWSEPGVDGKKSYVETIRYMGVDSVTKQWCRQYTYGGKLCENVVQALSRDIMGNALLLTERHPDYTPVLTVHDEIIAEVEIGKGSVREFEDLICQLPAWAAGFPIKAEGARLQRYQK